MLYEYAAAVERVVDGDTIDLVVDLGFDVSLDLRARLTGIDTAEIHFVSKESAEYRAGMRHKEFVEEWLQVGVDEYDGEHPFLIETEKDQQGKYGRYLATVIRRSDGCVLNEALIEEFGDAVRY